MIKFNNRDYSIKKVGGIPKLEEINIDTPIPNLLSKYYSINNYSIDNFIGLKIFASSYYHLNDVLDSIFSRISFDELSFQTIWNIICGGQLNFIEEEKNFNENPKAYQKKIRLEKIKMLNYKVILS